MHALSSARAPLWVLINVVFWMALALGWLNDTQLSSAARTLVTVALLLEATLAVVGPFVAVFMPYPHLPTSTDSEFVLDIALTFLAGATLRYLGEPLGYLAFMCVLLHLLAWKIIEVRLNRRH